MKSADASAHELLSLMVELSQSCDQARAITRFMQAFQDFWPDVHGHFTKDACPNAAACLPIESGDALYGYIIVANLDAQSKQDQVLIHQVLVMLGVVLKKLEQEAPSKYENPVPPASIDEPQAALLAQNALLEQILENYPYSYISVIEKDYTVGFASGREFKYAKLDPQAFIGLTLEQVFGEHAAYVKAWYAKTFLGNSQTFELFINDQHQLYRTVPLYNNIGKVDRILAVVENITDRKNLEIQLQESQAHLSIIFDENRDAQVLVRNEGPNQFRIVEVNRTYINTCNQYGLDLTAGDIVGLTLDEFMRDTLGLDEDALQATVNHYQQAIDTGAPATYDESMVFSGRPYYSTTTLSPIHRMTDNQHYVVFSSRDVTAEKQALLALQESEENYRLLVDNTPDFIYSFDRESRFTAVNRSFCKAMRLSEDQIVGKNHLELGFPEIIVKEWQGFHKQLFSSKEMVETETTTIMPDGKLYTNAVTLIPVFDENGDVSSIRGTSRDVTDRKKYEEQLKQQNAYIRMILDNSPIGIATNDLDTLKATYINQKYLDILDWTEADLPTFDGFLEKIIPDPEYRKAQEARIAADTASGDTERMNWDDLRITTKSGEERIIHAFNIPFPEQNITISTIQDVTERKRAEEELERNLEILTLGEDIANLGYFERNWQTGEGFWSKGFYKLLGEAPENVACKHEEFLEYIHPDDLPGVRQDIQRTLKNHAEMNVEFRLVQAGGDVIHIHGMGRNFYDEAGKPLNIIGTFQDITDRKIAEANLERSLEREKELADIVRDAPIAIANGYPDGRLDNCNYAFSELTGYALSELKHINWTEVLTPAKWRSFEAEKLSHLSPANNSVHYEKEYIRKDGSIVPVELTVSAGFDSDGNRVHYIAFITDITARKQAEYDLLQAKAVIEESEEKYRLIVENQNDLVVKFDNNSVLDYVSPNYCTTFGLKEGEILGTSFMPLVHEDDVVRVKQSIATLNQPPHTTYHEERDKTVDGWRWVAWSVRAMTDEYNNVLETVAVGRDISKQKEFEFALIKAKEDIEEKEQRLREAQRLSHVGSWVYDPVTQQPIWSEEMFRIWGLNPDDGAPEYDEHKQLIHPDDWDNFDKAVQDAVEKGTPYNFELRIYRPDGEIRTIITICHPIVDANTGKVVRLEGTIQDITDRKNVEEELQLREMHLRSLVENPAGYTIYRTRFDRTKGQIDVVQVSPSFTEVFGVPEEDKFNFQKWFTHVHPEDLAGLLKASEEGMKPPFKLSIEVRYNHPEQGLKWLDIRATGIPYDDDPNLIEYANGLILDITESKQAEEKLKESEKKYRLLVDNLSEGIWHIDRDSKTTFVNQSMADMLGYSVDEMIDKHLFEFMDKQGRDIAENKLESRRQGINEQHEFEFIRKDNERIYTLVDTTAVMDDNDQYLGALAGVLDITNRHQAEEKLRESEEKYRLNFEHAPIGYQSLDKSGHFMDVNASWLGILGYTREEVIGQWFGDFLHPQQRDMFRTLFPENIKRKDVISGVEFILRHKNGTYLTVDYTAKIQFDEAGEFVRTHCVFRDVTEQNKAQVALKESEERLRMSTEVSGIAVWEADLIRDRITRSPNHDSLFGLEQQELWNSESYWQPTHPEDRELSQQIIRDALAKDGPQVVQYDFRVIWPDDSIHWLALYGEVVERNAEGIATLMRGTIMDITERKQAEQALIVSEDKFRSLYENAPYGIVICQILRNQAGDAVDFIHLEGNLATAENTGFNLAELIGKKASEIVSSEDQVERMKRYDRVVKTGEQLNYVRYFDTYDRILQVTAFAFGGDKFILNFVDVTEQEKARTALKESESFQATLLNMTPNVIYLYDILENKNVYSNDGIMEILGYSIEEIHQMGDKVISSLMHPDDFNVYLSETFPRYGKQEDKDLIEHQYRMRHKDGTWRWLQSKESIYQRTADGIPALIFGVITDITKAVAAENEIKEHVTFLNSSMELSPFAMWIADPSGNIIKTNAALRAMLQLEDEQLIGKYNVLEDENLIKQDVMHLVRKVFSESLPVRFDIPYSVDETGMYPFQTGALLWLDISMFPITDENGNLRNVVCQWLDISERKEMVKTLQERNDYIEAIMEHMPIGFAINTIDDGDVKYMNDVFEQIYGWPREILTNTGIFFEKVFPDPEFRKQMRTRIVADMESGDPERMNWDDLRVVTSAGDVRYVHAYNIPLLSQNLMISTVQNVTERKLAQDQIIQSLREKETLLRELYHRTKNNMHVIQSMLTLQAAFSQNEEVARIVTEVGYKIQAMALVHQKLYQSQNLSSIPLQEYLPEVAQLLRQSYTVSPSRIALRLSIEPVSVLIDTAIPCGLILNELMSNAFKHAFPDERSGEIFIQLSQDDQGLITLSVSDNGVGVPQGFDFYAQDTLGLQSIVMIAEHQLQGAVKFTSNGGVTCQIQFDDTFYQPRI